MTRYLIGLLLLIYAYLEIDYELQLRELRRERLQYEVEQHERN